MQQQRKSPGYTDLQGVSKNPCIPTPPTERAEPQIRAIIIRGILISHIIENLPGVKVVSPWVIPASTARKISLVPIETTPVPMEKEQG